MDGMEHKPADGVALNAKLSDGPEDRLQEYQSNPFVYQMVRLYAREEGCTIEDVLYGCESITVEAPKLGYSTVGDAVRAQKQLNQSLQAGTDRRADQ